MDTDDMDSIIKTVTDLVREQLGDDAAAAGPDADLSGVEGADSLDVLRVVAGIERRYDVEIEDEDVYGAKTIREMSRCVRTALEEKAGSR